MKINMTQVAISKKEKKTTKKNNESIKLDKINMCSLAYDDDSMRGFN